MGNDSLSDLYYQHRTGDNLPMITIYNSPSDYVGKYVARIFIVERGARLNSLSFALVADSLEQIRAELPEGLHCTPSSPEDEPHIVETWL